MNNRKFMNNPKRVAIYGCMFILVAALACFIVGSLIVPNLIPLWDDLGPDVRQPRSTVASVVFRLAGRLF